MNDPTDRQIREKRLRIRAWRRGTKEMDLLLGPFADGGLSGLSVDELDAIEALLDENDNDLHTWVAGTATTPDQHRSAISLVRRYHNLPDLT